MPQTSTQAVTIADPCLIIRINRLYREGIAPAELYEATRGWWKVGPRREKAEYALAVFQGVVKAVYEIDGWHAAGTTPPAVPIRRGVEPGRGRWEFTGSLAPEEVRYKYLGKSVKHYLPTRGGMTPFLYVNC